MNVIDDDKWFEFDEELSIIPKSTVEETLEKIQRHIDQHKKDHLSIPLDMFNGILKKREPNPFDERTVEVNQELLDAAIMYLVLLAHQMKLQKREDGLVKCHVRYLKSFLHWGSDRVRNSINYLKRRHIIKYEILEDVRQPNIKILK